MRLRDPLDRFKGVFDLLIVDESPLLEDLSEL